MSKTKELLVLVLMFLLFLGCSDDGGNGDNNPDDGEDSETSDERIEIFSWWTAAGEVEALQALVNAFQEERPDVEVVNLTTEEGDGQAAKAKLSERMANNDPPDTFQLGPRDFKQWVEYDGDAEDNRLEPLDFLFEDEGWTEKFPDGVLEVLSFNDHYYAVPVNMHRQNTLFYNKRIVEEPPETLEAFFTLAESLKADGIVPLALSATGGWTLEILFRSVMAGSAGNVFQDAFFTGNIDIEDADQVAILEQVVADYQRVVVDYTNSDADELGWDEAAELLFDGTAAMYVHGDWAKGLYTSLSWAPGVDFDVAPALGSEGAFIYNVDTFALCKDGPNRDNAVDFLRVVGSPKAQEAFNKIKGSTPVHPDVDISDWDPVAKKTFEAFENATLLHNVEIHQFIATDSDGETLELADQLLNLYNGEITTDELIVWITGVYDEAAS